MNSLNGLFGLFFQAFRSHPRRVFNSLLTKNGSWLEPGTGNKKEEAARCRAASLVRRGNAVGRSYRASGPSTRVNSGLGKDLVHWKVMENLPVGPP